MLSYRHGYHAGNFADVLKHIILVELLDYLTLKEKPFDYIDSHAGAGWHKLNSEQANKTSEYTTGIGRLDADDFPELEQYFSLLYPDRKTTGKVQKLSRYPGSPAIAKHYLRHRDRGWLFEIHPTDYAAGDTQMRTFGEDGLQGMMGRLPPPSKRGLVLIDPSYEIKSDYQRVTEQLIRAYHKFATGIYALWYPVVDRERINRLERQLIGAGIRRMQLFELGLQSDTTERGMTSAGMIVINPPWTLFNKMQPLLPKLAEKLAPETGVYRLEVLAGEDAAPPRPRQRRNTR
jgi:23S rRNA (adenine2030-N6)-methyltransferase